MRFKSHSLTNTFTGIAREIKNDVNIYPTFDPSDKSKAFPTGIKFTALWDTGATNTAISRDVVTQCGLKPINFTTVHTARGIVNDVPVYLINLLIPLTGTGFVGVRATEGDLIGEDVLIGMDLITRGDFVITNIGGKTLFSFRHPSSESIDFMKSHFDRKNLDEKIGRNDPCPCGNGRKYKNCHG